MSSRVVVGIPMFNEALVAARVVRELACAFDESSYEIFLLVVDDGSTDGTGAIVRGLTGIEVIRHPSRRGVGAAISTMISRAYALGADYFAFQEGSGKVPAGVVVELVSHALSGRYEYVYGSRFTDGGCGHRTPMFRRVAIRLMSSLVRRVTGFPVSDITFGPRVIKLSSWAGIHPVIPSLIPYSYEQMMTIAALHHGLAAVERPVVVDYREGRTYSHVKFRHWSQIVTPWLAYTAWQRLGALCRQPAWLRCRNSETGHGLESRSSLRDRIISAREVSEGASRD